MKAAIDTALAKVVSRKLLAWVVGTVALFVGDVDAGSWVTMSCVYIGTQGAADIAERLIKARR